MNISDGDFDKIVTGKSGPSGPGAGELARIVKQLNTAYVSPIAPATESQQLSAIHRANSQRVRGGAAVNPGAFASVLEPLRAMGAQVRRFGFVQLSGTTAVWAVVVALFLVTATGGLAAAGVLPDPIQSAVSSAAQTVGIEVPRADAPVQDVEVTDPMGPDRINVTESTLAAQQAALASAEQAIQAAEQAQNAAQEAAAASARCMEESMAQLASLVESILGAATQAQALVTQARNIGGKVKACADQAAAAGHAGVGHATEAASLAEKASAGNPILSAQGRAAVLAAEQAATSAGSSAGRALAMSRSIVDNVSGLAAGLINSTMGMQQKPAPTAPPPPAAGTPGPPPTGDVADPAAWARWGMNYANQIMGSFNRGAGRGR